MDFTEDEFNRAKNKMLGDFNKALADAEALIKAGTEGSVKDSVVPAVDDASRIVETSLAGA